MEEVNPAWVPIIHTQYPGGLSFKCYLAYGSCVKYHDFVMFDYGEEMNLKLYGTELPPKYPLDQITVPMYFMIGEDDILCGPKDAKRLYSQMSEAARKYDMQVLKKINHIDFMYGKRVKEKVYDPIVKFLSNLTWS